MTADLETQLADWSIGALLGLEEIFGRDLPHNAQFVAGIRAAWQQLATHGAREAVARALNS